MWGKSKNKNEAMGYLGDMSPEQQQVLDEFKDWI